MTHELTQQGIDAYEAGDRAEAARLLVEAVREDSDNPDAWYYLAQLQTDPERKRQALQRVIRLRPDYPGAAAQLTALDEAAEDQMRSAATSPNPAGDDWVSAIPGAPADFQAALATLPNFVPHLFRDAGKVLSGDVDSVAEHATWWHIVHAVIIVAFINGLFASLAMIVTAVRFETADVTFPAVLTFPFLMIVALGAAVAGGVLFSYWYATRHANGTGTLLQHTAGTVMVWAPAALLTGLLLPLERLGIGNAFVNRVITVRLFLTDWDVVSFTPYSTVLTLYSAFVAVYALYLINQRLRKVHGFSGVEGWIAGLIMLLTIGLIV
jgi:hypothetical protein